MKFLSELKNKDLSNKTCLLRVDFNIEDEDLSEKNLRIIAVLPTIKFLISKGAKVVILSHRGRPPAKVQSLSLKPFAKILASLLKKSVEFITLDDAKKKIQNSSKGSIFLLENLRFFPEEEKNDAKFAKKVASLGDLYVNDAFGVSHRKDASVVAVTKFLPSYAGSCLENEIKNLSKAMENPKKPLIIILGGAKISDKIRVIKSFLKRADYILTGGGVANTFFAAQKLAIDNSIYEKNMIPLVGQLLKSKKIILPVDSVNEKGKILDIGPKTSRLYAGIIKNAKTIVWNGPMGYIESPKFSKGTEEIIKAILKSNAFAVIGGGETIASFNIKNYRPTNNIFLSTGGGAMLEYLNGKELPGIAALK